MADFYTTIEKRGSGYVVLHEGRIVTRVVPDEKYPGMYRVLHDGELSDMVNVSRATDAARALAISALAK